MPEPVTLQDIAHAAHVSRSEAGRCFHAYLGCSPVDALIQCRLQAARRLLSETTHTLQEISFACGFHSVSYFSRKFRNDLRTRTQSGRQIRVNSACFWRHLCLCFAMSYDDIMRSPNAFVCV